MLGILSVNGEKISRNHLPAIIMKLSVGRWRVGLGGVSWACLAGWVGSDGRGRGEELVVAIWNAACHILLA